jgi:hypothetical protein
VAGGVEEQQVDTEVEQMGEGEEHRLLHLGVGLDQQVISPETPGPHACCPRRASELASAAASCRRALRQRRRLRWTRRSGPFDPDQVLLLPPSLDDRLAG